MHERAGSDEAKPIRVNLPGPPRYKSVRTCLPVCRGCYPLVQGRSTAQLLRFLSPAPTHTRSFQIRAYTEVMLDGGTVEQPTSGLSTREGRELLVVLGDEE